jgi:peptide/nickel transport system substrate-binding protein
MVTMGWGYADATLLYALYHSAMIGGLNLSRVNDPDLDTVLSALAVAPTQEQFMDYAAQAQKYIVEKALAIPLYTGSQTTALSKRVNNPTIGWDGSLQFYDAWLSGK